MPRVARFGKVTPSGVAAYDAVAAAFYASWLLSRGSLTSRHFSCHTHDLQLLGMPLAHPTSTTTSLNFGSEPFLVVKFMIADPGEALADFNHRTEHPRQTIWVNEERENTGWSSSSIRTPPVAS
jgi:hypothetical protein